MKDNREIGTAELISTIVVMAAIAMAVIAVGFGIVLEVLA